MIFYFNNRRWIDYIAATFVVAVIFNPSFHLSIFRYPSDELFVNLMLSIAGSSASLLGFVLAANTFLISHTQHRRLNLLRKSAGYGQLINIMESNIWRLFFLTLLSGVSSLTATGFTQFALMIIAFMLVISSIALATLIWATMAVLALPLD